MQYTTNYNLPLYEGSDTPNLITGYNAAITALDTQLKAVADTAEFSPNPLTDANFDVTKLGSAKVTSNGIVYFIQQS